METQFAEQVTAGLFYEVPPVVEVPKAVAQRGGQLVQPLQERLRLQIRKMDTGQVQGRAIHANLTAIPRQNLLQMVHLQLLYYPVEVGLSREADVSESGPRDPGAIQYVARVDQDGSAHHRCQRLPVELQVLGPLRHQNQGIGVTSRLLGVGRQDQVHPGVVLPEPVHGDRTMCLHARAPFQQVAGDIQRGRLTQVVRVRFKRQAQQANGAALQDLQLAQKLFDHALAL